jgi:glycosyltransferase involved in cell wall biosynthesis
MPAVNNPKVSIIMPTFNRAGLIIETIESIRNQTYPNWELIIIDDGSEDATESVIAGVNDERIQYYKTEHSGDVSKVKNMGLQRASGDFIGFDDSDDLWAPSKLEKQVAALEKYPDIGFCVTNGYNFKKPGEPEDFFYKQCDGIRTGLSFIDYFTSQLAAFTQALIIKKEVIARIAGFKEVGSFSDPEFMVRLAFHFKGILLYEPLVYRRLHDENHSRANWEKGYVDGLALLEEYKDKLPTKVARNAFSRLYLNFGEGYLARGKTWKAVAAFVKAWKSKPLSLVPLKKIGKAAVGHLRKK